MAECPICEERPATKFHPGFKAEVCSVCNGVDGNAPTDWAIQMYHIGLALKDGKHQRKNASIAAPSRKTANTSVPRGSRKVRRCQQEGCIKHAQGSLPSFLTFSPYTRYTCVPFTITKLTSPTSTARSENRWRQAAAHHFIEWRRCKASYVPHTSRHVAAVLLEPSAPIQLYPLFSFVLLLLHLLFKPCLNPGLVRNL